MMRSLLFFLGILLLFSSCDDEKKTIELVEEGREIAAYVRTIETINADFTLGTDDVFNILLETNDEEDGDLLDAIDIYIRYKPFGASSTPEVFLKTLPKDLFVIGSFGLPQSGLEITFSEAAEAFNLNVSEISCRDQFEVRLDLNLTDGRSFSTGAASSKILAADDFWSSPFCYTINVVEPIEETLFTGVYAMESILDGPLGPTFGETMSVEIVKGHSTNTREMRLRHILSNLQEQKRIFRFTVACDQAVFSKNLLASKVAFCLVDPSILLGPDTTNGIVDPENDAVFELWFVEGYLGFDGNCGFETASSRYRFTKQ